MNTLSNIDSLPGAQPQSLTPQPPAPKPDDPPPLRETLSPGALVTIPPPVPSSETAYLIETKPLPPADQPRTLRRNGRIARLPKLERDMVCRMIRNGVPYKQIVEALDDAGFTVTERNISNWAAGGYLEWSLQQEQVLQNRLAQDDLLDYLRRQDASELPEVGLQVAATRLSQILLQKAARGDDLETNPGAFASQVNLLCRLNRELFRLQKYRDDCARNLGRDEDPARIRHENDEFTSENEQFYSNPQNFVPASPDLPQPQASSAPPAQPAVTPVAPAPPPSGAPAPAPVPVPVSAAPGRDACLPRPNSALPPAGMGAQSGQRPEPLPGAASPPVGPGRSW